ncbi:MAG TPA: RluA family pseudouridine synthase [Ramlibacter sp.]|nr:RluA family pseudouridine synthase [Ramlibacter sp.]
MAKPAGLLSVPGRGPDKQDCLARRVQQHYADALVVHRLDMATSGVWLMARGIDMQRALSRAFERQETRKRYVAVVAGRLDAPLDDQDGWGLIDLPIGADWAERPRRQVDHAHGKPSQTRWRVLQWDSAANTTRLLLEPLTGRTHQLRVHLQAIGHPILGDALYAPPAARDASPRLLLHATELSLAHPATGEMLTVCHAAPF